MLSVKRSLVSLPLIASGVLLASMWGVLPSTKCSAETVTDLTPLVALDSAQSLALFGQSLQAEYYNGSAVTPVEFTYTGLLSEILHYNFATGENASAWDSATDPYWAGLNFDGGLWGAAGVNSVDWLVYACDIPSIYQPWGVSVDFTVHIPFSIQLNGLEQFGFCTASSLAAIQYTEVDFSSRYNIEIMVDGINSETGAFSQQLSEMVGPWGARMAEGYTIPIASEFTITGSPVPVGIYGNGAVYREYNNIGTEYATSRLARSFFPQNNRCYSLFQGGNLLQPNQVSTGGYDIYSIDGISIKYRLLGNMPTVTGGNYTTDQNGDFVTENLTGLDSNKVYIFIACPYLGGEWSVPEEDKTTNDIYDIIEQNGVIIANIDNNIIDIKTDLGRIIALLTTISQNMSSGGGGGGFDPAVTLSTAETLPSLNISGAQSTAESAAAAAGSGVSAIASSASSGTGFVLGLLNKIITCAGFGWVIPAFSCAAIAAWFVYRGRGS